MQERNDYIQTAKKLLTVYRRAKYILKSRKSVRKHVQQMEETQEAGEAVVHAEDLNAIRWLMGQTIESDSCYNVNEEEIRFLERAISVMDIAADTMRKYNEDGERLYWLLYAKYLSDRVFPNIDAELRYMEQKGIYMSISNYYVLQKKVLRAYGQVLALMEIEFVDSDS